MLCSFRKHASTIKTVIVFKGGRKRPNKSNRRFALWRQSVYINFHIAKAPHDLASGPSHTPYLIRRYGDTAIRRYGLASYVFYSRIEIKKNCKKILAFIWVHADMRNLLLGYFQMGLLLLFSSSHVNK